MRILFRWTALALLPAAAACSPSAGEGAGTALDDYVAAPDDSFVCPAEPDKHLEGDGYSASVFRLTSQSWLNDSLVDRPEWDHWLSITAPDRAHPHRAMLYINGGRNDGGEAPDPDLLLVQMALSTQSIVAQLGQVPNDPLRFTDETDERYLASGRSSDEIIAYGWDRFLASADPVWLPRLPMTKAVVRAMDVVQREHPQIDSFVIVGGSKRGWTTWTVAAVDDRVIAIVPAVIDVLNVARSFSNHFAAYGFWAPAAHDYVDMGITDRLDSPEFQDLCDIVDPYSYRARFTMPKYIVNATGDQFFTPDSWKLYYDDLPGEKYLRYMPNTDHGLTASALFELLSFHHAIINDTPIPDFDWRLEADGNLIVECETQPEQVLLWQATNPAARDFRLEEIGAAFTSSQLQPEGDGIYRSHIQPPPEGWTAFLIEVTFPNPDIAQPLVFTTGVNILPDTLPHQDLADRIVFRP